MKKFLLIMTLIPTLSYANDDFSILEVSHLTAAENKEIKQLYENGELDGFVVKTTKGLLAFHSVMTDEKAAKVLINAKPTQCIKVTPNIDDRQDQLIYGVTSAKIIGCNAINHSQNQKPNVKITNVGQMSGEPEGLKIVDFIYNNKSYTYRVYCPNYTVRNVSGNKFGKSHTTKEEDQLYFNGQNVIQYISKRICK